MPYSPPKHRRRSVRVPKYNYAAPGGYFITIVARGRVCMFGDVVNDEVQLNDLGLILVREWTRTAELRPNVVIDTFVVMPNHIHGIVIIRDSGGQDCGEAAHRDGMQPVERFGKPTVNSIPTVVRSFKSSTTKHINIARGTPGQPLWQRNYYEHVIRDAHSLRQLQLYVERNPRMWQHDRINPASGQAAPAGL